MKKLLSILALLALLVVPWQASAITDELTVADGETTNQTVPIYGYNVDATGGQHNQVIYPAEMLEGLEGMNLTALSFYLSQVATAAWNTTVTLSMAEVDDTSLADGLIEAELTQVWQGNATGMDAVWTIEFTNAYAYGGGNLLVDITCTKATWKRAYFYGIESTGKSRYSYGSYNTVQDFIPKTKFTYSDQAFCYIPTNLTVSNITANGATLTWSPGGSETAWVVWDGTDTYETTDTFYTFTTLEPATVYTVGVMADCGNQNTSSILATTFQTAYEGDYVTIADGTATNNYIPIYGNYVDEAQHNQILYPASMLTELVGDSLTGFIFYMSSVAAADWGTTVTVSLAEVADESVPSLIDANLIQVWQGEVSGMESEWYLAFDNNYRYMGSNLLVDITTTEGTYKSSSFYGVSASANSSICTYGTSTQKQAFLPKVAIFYAESDAAICYMPTDLSVTEITPTGATVHWSSQGTGWNILLNGEPHATANDTLIVFTGLEPATQYSVSVQTICGNDYSNPAGTSFTTSCANGECELTATLTGSLYTSSYYGGAIDVYQNDGLRGSLTTSNTTVSVCKGTPVELRHSATSSYGSGHATVINGAGETVLDADVSGSGTAVGTVLVTLDEPCPSCYVPSNLQVSNINENGFTLSWEPVGEEEAWQITLINGTDTNIIDVTETSITFNQLNPETEYTVELRADCGNDGLSSALTTTVETPASGFVPATAPYETGFEANEEEIAFWQFINDATNAWVINSNIDDNGMLFISDDGGESNNYTVSVTQVSYATRQMEIAEAGLYNFEFDYMGQGESNYDYLRAWVAPASVELTAGKLPNGNTSTSGYTTTTPNGWYDLGGKMNQKSDWTHVTKAIELPAGSYKLVLMWCNDNGSGTQPPAAVDNLEFAQMTAVTINAHSADETMGTVEGAGEYEYGAEVTLTAVPASNNYYFTQWSTGETTESITFTANLETMATEYIAYFEANVVTVTVDVNNEEAGTVTGAGEYPNGDSAVLTVTPNDGWVFTQWSDGNTDNPRIIENLAANVSLTALFAHPYGVVEEMAIDFEENASEYFFYANGTGANQWIIGNTNADNHALFISNDGGQSNNYTNNAYTSVFAYMTVTLEAGIYDYSFDWSAYGESSYDFLRVALVPTDVVLTASNASSQPSGWSNNSLPTGAIALDGGTKLNGQSSVQTKSGSFEVAEANDYNLAFYWRNDNSTGTNPAGMIDNIFIALNNEPIAVNAYGADDRGEVSFDQEEYFYGDSAFLTAEPFDNYVFSHWNTGENTQTIGIRVDASTPENEYIAYFLPAYPILTVEYEPDFGEVNGIVNGQVSVANGGSVTIEAVPNDGYFFGGWSDGNHENPRTIVLTDDMLLGCTFGAPSDTTIIDFEGENDYTMWTLEYGTCLNKWGLGLVPYGDTVTNALFISNNYGEDYAYNTSSASSVFALTPISLKAGIYQSSFEWKANGEAGYDFLRAALVPSNIVLNASTSIPSGWGTSTLPTGAIALDGGVELSGVTEWQTETYNVQITEDGMYNLVFFWRNDNGAGNQPPAAVDNISIVNTHAMFMVNASPQDGNRGYVDGAGQYEYGENVTLTAYPYDDYTVAYWIRNNDTLYGESITVRVDGDVTPYVAYFFPAWVTIQTGLMDSHISVYDQDSNILEGNSEYAYEGGRDLAFTVVAAQGYEANIILNDKYGYFIRESELNATSTLELVAEDNYRLEFGWMGIPIQIVVNATNGTNNTIGSTTAYYGDEVTIAATPAMGYQFLGWADEPSAGNQRVITVTDDMVFTAIIEPIEPCVNDTTFVHDTTILTDTVYAEVEVHDTVTVTEVQIDTVTLTETIFDTVTLTETIFDTVTLTETIIDTVIEVQVDTVTLTETIIDTVIEVQVDTVTVTETIFDTVIEVQVDTVTVTETLFDTVTLTDTLTVEVEVHDTAYVDVHDTTIVEVTVFDTVTVTEYVNVMVHDTMYVNRYIYDSLYFYDTTYVHDTTIVNNIIRDTTYVTVNDSIIETLVDTMYVYVNDTTQIYNIVHDTNYVYIHDTTVVTNYDTLTVTNTVVDSIILNNYIHDTTLVEVPVHDTTLVEVTVFDTVIMTEYVNVLVHDTMYVNRYIYDSLFFYDTTYVHDTSYIYQWMFDTTYVTVNDSIIETLIDTMYVFVNDTTQIYNLVHDTTYVFVHDTTVVTNYDTLTVVNTVVDSVILNNYIHDTTVVTETVYDTVTNTEYVYDTVTNTIYDTVTNTEYVYDTVTNTIYDTVTMTQTDTVTNTEYVYDTVTVTEIDTVTVTETDTLWMTDTLVITIHDTVYVHDTIYVGIGDEAVATNVKLYQRDGQIVVEGAEGARVMLYDAVGRQLATKTDEYDVLRFDVPATGAYLIKVGNAPARRIVVVR